MSSAAERLGMAPSGTILIYQHQIDVHTHHFVLLLLFSFYFFHSKNIIIFMLKSHQKEWTKLSSSCRPHNRQIFDNVLWNGSSTFFIWFFSSFRFRFCVIKPIVLSRTFNTVPNASRKTLLCGLYGEIKLIVKSLQNGEKICTEQKNFSFVNGVKIIVAFLLNRKISSTLWT